MSKEAEEAAKIDQWIIDYAKKRGLYVNLQLGYVGYLFWVDALKAYADQQVKEAKEYSELEKSYDFAQAKKIKAENERLKGDLLKICEYIFDKDPPSSSSIRKRNAKAFRDWLRNIHKELLNPLR